MLATTWTDAGRPPPQPANSVGDGAHAAKASTCVIPTLTQSTSGPGVLATGRPEGADGGCITKGVDCNPVAGVRKDKVERSVRLVNGEGKVFAMKFTPDDENWDDGKPRTWSGRMVEEETRMKQLGLGIERSEGMLPGQPLADDDCPKSKPLFGAMLPLGVIRGRQISTTTSKAGWVKVAVTVDSGACETGIPSACCPHAKLTPSEASRRGDLYEVADGNPVPN